MSTTLIKTQCSICEKDIPRPSLEYVELGKHLPPNLTRSFYACHECATREKLSWYETNFTKSRDTIDKLKIELNEFRLLMMSVEVMQVIGENDNKTSIKTYILHQRPGWESLSLETIKHFLDLHEECAREFARILNQKASKEEIKAHLKSQTSEAIASQRDKTKLEKVKLNNGLTLEYTSVEKENGTTKAVKSLMKS